jgi:nicotinamidase-related amidase
MNAAALLENSAPFLQYLADWEATLPSVELARLTSDPKRLAVISVDVINGFCHAGPLASPRVKDIIAPIVRLFERAHAAGVRHFLLAQDTHDPEAVEFGQYPPHCVRGTDESEAVPEFKALPFYEDMVIFPKNSIHSALDTGLEDWLTAHPEVDTFIAVGDCTDLCTYQLAMHLRLRANARQFRHRVVLPVECVDTYDLPVEAARQIGATPHDGDLLHLIFLYSMMLNGVEVVRAIS